MDMTSDCAPGSPGPRFPEHPAHYPTTPRQRREKENRRLKRVVAIEAVVIAALVMLLLFSMAASAVSGLVGAPGRIRKKVIRRGEASSRIAVIPVAGLLYSGGGPGRGSTDWILEALEEAERDPLVRAVVLEIDSPGGTISSADVIHHRVKRLRGKGKTVVAFLGSVAASGGYYVACPADHIVASRTAITGSIGVIMQAFRVDELMGKIGVEVLTVKSGRMKDIGSPFRAPTNEEREILQALADEAHERFVSVVAEGRGLSKARALELADGRVMSASQAMDAGLADAIGYLEDALESAGSKAGVPEATVVRYERHASLVDALFGASGGPDPVVELARILAGMGPAYLADDFPSAFHLWRPTAGIR